MIRIFCGDAIEVLKTLPDESVHCVVTSPPYWGLRSYGHDDQYGLEATPQEHVEQMVRVFREVRRVLRSDAVMFLNYGDSYASGGRADFGPPTSTKSNVCKQTPRPPQPPGLKEKDLIGMPWRVALALQADGWWLRSDIIWHKPNPMPESVTDRPTKAHEYVFLLTKKARYFYDADAIREPHLASSIQRAKSPVNAMGGPNGEFGARISQGGDTNEVALNPAGRNKRDVWTIPTSPFPGAHFATFPPALVEPCIKAGTSEKGCCPECGAPWVRVVEKTRTFESGSGKSGNIPKGKHGPELQGGGETLDVRRGPCVSTKTIGWRPSCDCYDEEWEAAMETYLGVAPMARAPHLLSPSASDGTPSGSTSVPTTAAWRRSGWRAR